MSVKQKHFPSEEEAMLIKNDIENAVSILNAKILEASTRGVTVYIKQYDSIIGNCFEARLSYSVNF